MTTGELVTFAILAVIVIAVAAIGRRMQSVQPPASSTRDPQQSDATAPAAQSPAGTHALDETGTLPSRPPTRRRPIMTDLRASISKDGGARAQPTAASRARSLGYAAVHMAFVRSYAPLPASALRSCSALSQRRLTPSGSRVSAAGIPLGSRTHSSLTCCAMK